jgi:beta-glucuronidase
MGLGLIDVYSKHAPELDFIGVNAYPAMGGFGSLWEETRVMFDRPVVITEFGCDAYWTGKGPDETTQANYIRHCLEDVAYNSAGEPGMGNALGSIVFEWADEWWKDTNGDAVNRQNREPTIEAAFPDGWSQEEWLGITGQGDGSSSPFLREIRVAVPMLKELWKAKPAPFPEKKP